MSYLRNARGGRESVLLEGTVYLSVHRFKPALGDPESQAYNQCNLSSSQALDVHSVSQGKALYSFPDFHNHARSIKPEDKRILLHYDALIDHLPVAGVECSSFNPEDDLACAGFGHIDFLEDHGAELGFENDGFLLLRHCEE